MSVPNPDQKPPGASDDRQKNGETSSSDWFQFFDSLKNLTSLPLFLGIVVLVLVSLALGYLGSKRSEYIRQYYPLVFNMNYVEFIKPGTKIRYQGALVVGVVESVENKGAENLVHVRIKQDFAIPKKGSHISLQTWGYFGDKFLNIDVLSDYLDTETYQAGDMVPIAPVTNFTHILSTIDQVLKKDQQQGYSILEKNLLEARDATRILSNNQLFDPEFMTKIIQITTKQLLEAFRHTNNFTADTYEVLNNVNITAEEIVQGLQRNLPRLRSIIINLYSLFKYNPGPESSLATGYWHKENSYDYIVAYMRYLNDTLEGFRKAPYTIIFKE